MTNKEDIQNLQRALEALDVVLAYVESLDGGLMPESLKRDAKMSYRNLRARVKYYGEKQLTARAVKESDSDDSDDSDERVTTFADFYDSFERAQERQREQLSKLFKENDQ
jgi:hypothetical protein